MRGKRLSLSTFMGKKRITPAGAGKTGMPANLHSQVTDHPRRCGENAEGCRVGSSIQGSPPQVRGKLCSRSVALVKYRITPAGAGKTLHTHWNHGGKQDHPRRCGENRRAGQFSRPQLGSPPQVRGKRNFEFLDARIDRITPAGAGKTLMCLL